MKGKPLDFIIIDNFPKEENATKFCSLMWSLKLKTIVILWTKKYKIANDKRV